MKRRYLTMAACATVLALTVSGFTSEGQEGELRQEAATEDGSSLRLREGSALADQSGAFRLEAERVVFTGASDSRQLIALENLALERVSRALRQSASPQTWLVSGTITEFQGNNYLLIERAVLSRTAATKAH